MYQINLDGLSGKGMYLKLGLLSLVSTLEKMQKFILKKNY